jgi:hypothetical protein
VEVSCELLEAGRDTPVMLEFVEEALDPVTQLVGVRVVGDFGLPRAKRWDDDIDLSIGKEDAKVIGVVSFVGDQADKCQTPTRLAASVDS